MCIRDYTIKFCKIRVRGGVKKLGNYGRRRND